MPDLETRNLIPWEVFQFAASQLHVVGMGTPLGLHFSAIDRAMEFFHVHPLERDTVFNRVRRLGEEYAKLLVRRQEESVPVDKRPKRPDMAPPSMRTPAEQDALLKAEEVEMVEDSDGRLDDVPQEEGLF